MKVLVDLADNKLDSFMELIKGQSYLKAKPLSAPDAAILEEINHIKKAFKLADKITSRKN